MSSTLSSALSIFRREGGWVLAKKAVRKICETYFSLWGKYSLSIDDVEVSFSAPTVLAVYLNRARFRTEQPETRDFLEEIRPGDVVYDIGANTGLYTLFAAKTYPESHVVAFEPYPPNVALLEQDIERNGVDNVDVRDVALSDSDGTVEFSQPEKDVIGYGSSGIATDGSEGSVETRTVGTSQPA